MNKKYIHTGTLRVCSYSEEITIITANHSEIDKSKCTYFKECTINPCPLEKYIKH